MISTVTRLISFGFKIYLSRSLGAEILGLYQICMSLFVLLACFSSTGLPLTLSRKTAENEIIKNYDAQNKIFSSSLISSCAIALFFCLFFGVFQNAFNLIFNDARCTQMFLFMMPALISTSIYSITRAWFWGKKDYLVYSITELIEEILKILLTVFFISSVFTANQERGLALAFMIADVACAIILLAMFFKKGGRIKKPGYFKEITKSAAPLTSTRIFTSFANSITALILPVLLVKFGMSTAQATAEFGRASGMVMPILFAPTSIVGALAVVLIPELAALKVKKQQHQLESRVNNAILFSCLISCVFFALFAALGKQIGLFLYNDIFAGEYLAASAFVVVPMCMNQICVTVLNAIGFEGKTFKSNIVGLVLLLGCAFILPRFLGIYSFFVGLFIYHMLTLIINMVFLVRHAKIPMQFCGKMILVLLISIVAALCGYFMCRLIAQKLNLVITILLSGSTVILIYLILSLLFGLIDVKELLKRTA